MKDAFGNPSTYKVLNETYEDLLKSVSKEIKQEGFYCGITGVLLNRGYSEKVTQKIVGYAMGTNFYTRVINN